MKKLFFILTVLSLPTFSTASAQTIDCAAIKSVPAIEFTTSYGKLAYDFSKNNKQITEIAARHGIIEKGLFASGLATINVSWEISVNTIGKIYGDYDICVVPTKINVFIGYTDPKIYISNEIKKDSCEYNVVLRHEQTHQQINKTALDYFIPLFQDAVEKIAANVKPVQVSSLTEIDKATTRLTQTYDKKISPLIKVFKEDLLTEQSKLDNHSNYEHEKKLCTKKLKK